MKGMVIRDNGREPENAKRAKILMPSVLQIAAILAYFIVDECAIETSARGEAKRARDWKINATKFICKSEGCIKRHFSLFLYVLCVILGTILCMVV